MGQEFGERVSNEQLKKGGCVYNNRLDFDFLRFYFDLMDR